MKKFKKHEVRAIKAKIHSEGFEYYFSEYEDPTLFKGTVIEAPLKAYLAAKIALEVVLEEVGVLDPD